MPTRKESRKHNRGRIDLLQKGVMKHLVKKFGRSKQEIEDAISKVGNHPDTVMNELRQGCADRSLKRI